MSVEEKNKIDIITTNKQGILVLTISDHLEWDCMNEHLLILQEKINSYLDFLESGQIYESYPGAVDKEIMIQIVFKYLPNRIAQEFLEVVKKFLNEKGYDFKFYQLVL
ncbi:hypothetical protein BC749_101307 [Flavobacterium araucananum]|uniref:Uncharacterized protein n=1 Tax=Flavobacterium araucananum TaxID=946678 RepID=A0A227NFV4_9FLAO|nr:DUF6572 domain-containing protein [Flavobacterium araucananum]OXE96583.1 hypothetical protein B0A64_23720 [Flavobacterium araucananum]PWK02244.1 hypothetical protein BC749_101307 [Flavobacterium araucananum]